jgi:hypothetical protein
LFIIFLYSFGQGSFSSTSSLQFDCAIAIKKKKAKMFTKSITAIISLFSFSVFFNSQEASAFSPAVKTTPNAAFATRGSAVSATTTSKLAAAVNGHSQSCSCDSCRGVTHGAACSCPACSRTAQHKTHGAACSCSACSQTQHKTGCACSSCSSRSSHGPACGCPSCQE